MPSRPLLETTLVEETSTRDLERRIKSLEDEVANLRQSVTRAAQEGVKVMLRQMFAPLHSATSVLAGEAKVTESAQANGKWDAIKQRVGPKLAGVIDLLMVQGPMTVSQIAAATRCSGKAARQRMDKLRGQGLVDKNGVHFNLK